MIRSRIVVALIGVFFGLALFSGGFITGIATSRPALLVGPVPGQPQDIPTEFNVFWEAWSLVQRNYVDRSAIDPTNMTYGAIGGMLDSLGDVGHTRLLTPDELRHEQQILAGEFEGIGAEISIRDGHPTIMAAINGSPAQRAGLRSGDVLMRINGRDVTGLSLSQIISLVRGPAGTSVTLTVVHPGETTLIDITVVRERISVPDVTWALLPGTTVAHIQISLFGENVGDELAAALRSARSQGMTAIILDLRNNPGGFRDEAVAVASHFLREGDVALEQDAQGRRTALSVRPGGMAIDAPLVVLINEGSASAAEIVAGAIQDYGRAKLVGQTTFGTGTVLMTFSLSDGSAILLGTEQWLTPTGRQIWHVGIRPDVEVALPADVLPLTPDREADLTPEQLQANQDIQLLRALQIVRSE